MVVGQVVGWLKETWLVGRRTRIARGPIDSEAALLEFIETRSAFIAQTSLYGYLKTRMGTRYPEYFLDDVFVAAIDRAKWLVYCACVSDLTVFCLAYASHGAAFSKPEMDALALRLHDASVSDALAALGEPTAGEIGTRFAARVEATIWPTVPGGDGAFKESPEALSSAAPVIEAFRRADKEIVMNSVLFRWKNVRDEVRKRLDPPALLADVRAVGR